MLVSAVNASMSSFSTSWEPPGWLVQKVISSAGSTSARSTSPPWSPPLSSDPPLVSGPQADRPSAATPSTATLRTERTSGVLLCLLRQQSDGGGSWPRTSLHGALGEAGDDVALQRREDHQHRDDDHDRAGHEDAVAAGLRLDGLQQVEAHRQGHLVRGVDDDERPQEV